MHRINGAGILHKAEATWGLFHPIKSHDDAFYLSAHPKQLVDLVFIRVEGKVSHIKGATVLKLMSILIRTTLGNEVIPSTTLISKYTRLPLVKNCTHSGPLLLPPAWKQSVPSGERNRPDASEHGCMLYGWAVPFN